MAYSVQVIWNTDVQDTALLLNLLTDPTVLVVYGAQGISFKLDAGGADDIAANPFAVVADEDGLGIDRILLSNSSGVEQTVFIYAAQES